MTERDCHPVSSRNEPIRDLAHKIRPSALSKDKDAGSGSGMTGRDCHPVHPSCHPVVHLYGISPFGAPVPSSRSDPIRDLALTLSKDGDAGSGSGMTERE